MSITPLPADERALIRAMYDDTKKAVQDTDPPPEPSPDLAPVKKVKKATRRPRITEKEFNKNKQKIARDASRAVYKQVLKTLE